MKIKSQYTLCLLVVMLASFFYTAPAQAQKLKERNEIILAYYGRPNVKSLGVLGQHSPTELLEIIKAKASEYAKAVPGTRILPAVDIIYDLASAEPGKGGNYLITLSQEHLQPYLDLAADDKLLVFLDLQLGKKTPVQAILPVLKYLEHRNVHLAIDPEFEVHGLDKRPGKVIGHIEGEDVNQVQEAMQDYMTKHNVAEDKYLMVHNFTQSMVKNKSVVKDYQNINLIMNLDGHGPPHLKVDIYNGLYNETTALRVDGGFKLFFKEDHPMMTPEEVLGLKAVKGGARIKEMPRFINYQ